VNIIKKKRGQPEILMLASSRP